MDVMNVKNVVRGRHEMKVEWYRPAILWKFLKFVFRSFLHHRGLENAKSLTYTSLFAVVPLITILLTILSTFTSFQEYGSHIQDMIFERMLPSSTLELEEYFAAFADQARHLTWAGTVMLVVTAYLMLVNIERNFNRIWGVTQLRKGMSSFLLYWSVLSLSPLLLGVGFAISSYFTSLNLVQSIAGEAVGEAASRFRLMLFPLILTTAAFTLLYVAVPNCGVKLRHGIVGGLVVAISFALGKQLFNWFISLASYQLTYGTFAALPIFLLWLYLSWVVILFGANLVRCIPLFRDEHIRVEDRVHNTVLVLCLLHKCWEKYQHGETLKIEELVSGRWPFHKLAIDDCLQQLMRYKLISPINEDEYILSRDLHGFNVWTFMIGLPWSMPRSEDLADELPEMLAPHFPAYAQWREALGKLEQEGRECFNQNLDSFFRSAS